MADRRSELVSECNRQSETCVYRSTALFIWLRCLRIFRVLFVVLPIVLGAVASWKVLTKSNNAALEVAGTPAGMTTFVCADRKCSESTRSCGNADRSLNAIVLPINRFSSYSMRCSPHCGLYGRVAHPLALFAKE